MIEIVQVETPEQIKEARKLFCVLIMKRKATNP